MVRCQENEKKQEQANLPSLEEIARATAERLVWAANSAALNLFRNKRFRKLVKYKKLEQTERDRIYNELQVTAILLIIFTFEAPDLRGPEELKSYLRHLKDEIPKAHSKILKEMGIERKFRRLWKKLIDIRYKEYKKDKFEIRKAAMELYSMEKPLTTKDLAGIQLTLPLETLAIGCLHHTRRGETEPEDPLFIIILDWLGDFYLQIRPIAEGIKPSLWQRLHLRLILLKRKLKRTLRRIGLMPPP